MTWLEWCAYSAGIEKNKVKNWEHTRTLAWLLYKTNADPKTSAKTMLQWWPLPTDIKAAAVKRPAKTSKKLSKKQFDNFVNSMK